MQRRPSRIQRQGFTLIEVLVAISIMAVMAVLSWRGLDGMTQTQARLQQRADEVLTLQAGLNQWGADLDALIQLPQNQALEWDGRALRMTRRSATALIDNTAPSSSQSPSDESIWVVAWARRDTGGQGQWLRWQSPPLRTRGEVDTAWAAAAQWAQNPGDALKAREVMVSTLTEWQIFFYRGDAWTNPLSSEGIDASTSTTGTTGAIAGPSAASSIAIGIGALGVAAAQSLTSGANALTVAPIPEGVRLVLTLPPGQAISGTLTRDWVRPTLGGRK
jgi:general secretion pathway protein J